MKRKLTVNVGSMFSGKTTELLRQGKRHTIAKDKVLYIKPTIDARYSNTKIVSHDGEASDYTQSMVVDINDSIYCDEVLEADVILIDEIQFFNFTIIDDILRLLDKGKVIYCSGLDLTFDNAAFMVTGSLMCHADVINKFKAVCNECGNDAHISARKNIEGANKETIDIGSSDKYTPLCRKCYSELNTGGMV
jgi:thymidine kinase